MQAAARKAVSLTVPYPPLLSRLTFGDFAEAGLRVALEFECVICGRVHELDPHDEALRHLTIASRSHRCTALMADGEPCRGTGFARIRRRA
jgi:hypothetical protein